MECRSYTLCRSQANHDSFTNPAGTSGRILGSTTGSTSVEVLVTVQGDGVVVYNTSKQQRTKSWPLGSRGTTFAAPAIWDHHSARYYAALASPSGEQSLVSWEKGADASQSLSEAPAKAALGGPVHSLWPVSQRKIGSGGLASGAVVVLHDGSLIAFGGDLAETCRLHAGGKSAGIEAVAASTEDGALFLALSLVGRASGPSRRSVQIVELTCKTGEKGDVFEVRQQVDLQQVGEGASLSVASIALGRSLDLSVLWSNGRWESFMVDRKECFLCKRGHERLLAIFQPTEGTQGKAKKTPKKKRAAQEERTDLEAGRPAWLIAIPGSSYVAAVGPEGFAGGLVGVVMDSRYGCLHKRFAVTAEADTAAKADSLSTLLDSGLRPVVDLQAGAEEGLLLVSTSAEVIVCKVSLAPLSLAGMLGALSQVRAGRALGVRGGTVNGLVTHAEESRTQGWGGMADQAAVAASVVYGQSGIESLRVPASGVVLSPSISGRGDLAEASGLVSREEGVWDVGPLESLARSEEELLDRIRGAESEQELAGVLVEHLGGERKGGDPDSPGANGLPNGVQANGRDHSDDSEMEDVLPNGGHRENGVGRKHRGKGEGAEGQSKARQLSKLLRRSSSQLITAVVERSLQSEYWLVIESVLWLGTLPPGTDGRSLVRALANAQQLHLLEKVMSHLRDLAPSDLAFLLRFLIGDADDVSLRKVAAVRKERAAAKLTKLAGAVKDGQVSKARRREVSAVRLVADAVDLFTPRESALHHLVAVPRDETVLAAALRELTAAEVTFLVGYFGKWMDVYFDRSELLAPTWGSVVLPSLAQVVLWLSLLVDVHLTRLALLPDCHQVVSRLHKVVAAQVVLTRKLVPLGGVTAHIQRKAKLPSRRAPSGKPAGAYSVELLNLE